MADYWPEESQPMTSSQQLELPADVEAWFQTALQTNVTDH